MTARVAFGAPPDDVVFPVVDFAPYRLGSDQAEIVGTRATLPFAMHLTVPLRGGNPTVRFRIDLVDRDFRSIQIFSRGIAALQKCGRIRMVNLETEAMLFEGVARFGARPGDQEFREFVDDIVSLEDFLRVPIYWPSRFEEGDFEVIEILRCLKDGQPFSGTMTLAAVVVKGRSEDENAQVARAIVVA